MLKWIALFGPDGKIIEESNANNNPELRAKVEAVFLAASREESPCVSAKPEEKKKSGSSSTTPQ